MTGKEWGAIKTALIANWPHSQLPDVSLAKWKLDLDDLPAAEVLVAVETTYQDGTAFAPNGGQMRRKVMALRCDAPRWSGAWNAILDAATRFGHWNEQPALDHLDAFHPLVGQLAREIGFKEICLCEDPLTVLEAQCRGKYEHLVDREEREATYRGLPSAGLRTLERVNAAPKKIGFRDAIEAPK